MENARIINQSVTNIQNMVANIPTLEQHLENQEKRCCFFQNFPFEDFGGELTSDELLLTVKLFYFFCSYEEFYRCKNSQQYCVEFMLNRLETATKRCSEVELNSLLELVLKFLEGYQKHVFLLDYALDKEQLLTRIIYIAQLEFINETTICLLNEISRYVLHNNEFVTLRIKYVISQVFETVRNTRALQACFICKVVLYSTSINYEEFSNIYRWLMYDSPLLLAESTISKNLACELLKCLSLYLTKYICISEGNPMTLADLNLITDQLMKVTTYICIYSSFPEMRENCFLILEKILLSFFAQNNLVLCENIGEALGRLPLDVEEWPKSNEEIFFYICHIAIQHNQTDIWTKKSVLNAIFNYFYSNVTISKPAFNSLCFLYPYLIKGSLISVKLKALGDDLLNYFEKIKDIIPITNELQLKWVLENASINVKIEILCSCMSKIHTKEEFNKLANTLKHSEIDGVLLHIILNKALSVLYGDKAAYVLRAYGNRALAKKVAIEIPLNIQNSCVLKNLLIAGPAVPEGERQTMLICTMMSYIIPMTGHEEALKQACVFSIKLLTRLRNDPKAVTEFCREIHNIKYLADIAVKVDEDVCIQVLSLLKVLISLQQRHKIDFQDFVELDFESLLNGSSVKISKILKLLMFTLNWEKTLLKISPGALFSVYRKILDLSFNAELEFESYICIILFLKKNPYLTYVAETIVHVQVVCSQASSCCSPKKENILKMLDVWLKLITRRHLCGFCILPVAQIKSFILLANLDSDKLHLYLNIIERLSRHQTATLLN